MYQVIETRYLWSVGLWMFVVLFTLCVYLQFKKIFQLNISKLVKPNISAFNILANEWQSFFWWLLRQYEQVWFPVFTPKRIIDILLSCSAKLFFKNKTALQESAISASSKSQLEMQSVSWTPDLLTWNLHFSKIPSEQNTHLSLQSTVCNHVIFCAS